MIKVQVKRKDENGNDLEGEPIYSMLVQIILFSCLIFLDVFAVYSLWNYVFIDFITSIKTIDMFQAFSIIVFTRLVFAKLW